MLNYKGDKRRLCFKTFWILRYDNANIINWKGVFLLKVYPRNDSIAAVGILQNDN
jgi:hypothetical protein